eukprot:1139111-Pelagomonas_calceolata.AAC.6
MRVCAHVLKDPVSCEQGNGQGEFLVGGICKSREKSSLLDLRKPAQEKTGPLHLCLLAKSIRTEGRPCNRICHHTVRHMNVVASWHPCLTV